MHEIGRDKVYRATIEFQIREKLTELEQNYPREVKDIVKHFGLEKFMSRIETPMWNYFFVKYHKRKYDMKIKLR